MSDVTVDAELAQVPGHPPPPAQLPITDIPQWMEQPHFYLQIETIVYVIGCIYMEHVLCPTCKGSSVRQMKEILAKGGKKALPQLRERDGFFFESVYKR